MTEQYPFFKEADERTQAVIGEEAIASDLNGTYQKPYAVLTQKRLYCKNERGNFITEADQVLGAGMPKRAPKWLLWIAFVCNVLFAFLLVAVFAFSVFMAMDPSSPTFMSPTYLGVFALAQCALVILFLAFRKSQPKLAPALLCPVGFFAMPVGLLWIVPVVVYYFMGGGNSEWFEIRHSTGTFTFSPKQYPAGELKNFEAKVKALKAGVGSGK